MRRTFLPLFAAASISLLLSGPVRAQPNETGTPAEAPSDLITVTLKSESPLVVVPILSIGADIVNRCGKDETGKEKASEISFQCLPGALVVVSMDDEWAFLPLSAEDDKQTLNLRWDECVLYANDAVVFVDFTTVAPKSGKQVEVADDIRIPELADSSDEKQAEQQRLAKARAAIERAMSVLKRDMADPGATAGKKRTAPPFVNVGVCEEHIAVLELLGGSGAGVAIELRKADDDEKRRFWEAVARVAPRQLYVDADGFEALKGALGELETLWLGFGKDGKLPDLSECTNLRHLLLIDGTPAGSGDLRVDLRSLSKMKQLRALVLHAENPIDLRGIEELSSLQFLQANLSSAEAFAALGRLPQLRYYAGEVPDDADFSVFEKTPHLQTLCILNPNKNHRLSPLAKVPSLRCLAIGEGLGASETRTPPPGIQKLKEQCPNLRVVKYEHGFEGICMGSFWLIPMLFLAALSAFGIRRWSCGTFGRSRG